MTDRKRRPAARGGAPRSAAGVFGGSGMAFRVLFEENPQPMMLVDRSSLRYMEVNEAARIKYGYTREEFLRMRITDIRPPEDVPRLKEYLARLPSGPILVHAGVWRHRLKDGRLMDAEVQFQVVSIGGRDAILAVIHDVTEHRQAKEALKKAEERLRTVVASAPVVFFAVDRDGVFTVSEGKGLEALGLRPGEAVGRCAFEMYRDVPRVESYIRRALAGEAFTGTVEVGRQTYETRYSPHVGPGGRIDGVIGLALDVTDRRRVEEERDRLLLQERSARTEAESALRAKDEFLALISHELRTPMTAMLGWMWLLRAKQVGEAEQHRAFDTIERNMKLQAQIIEDLLDVSSIVTGKLRIDARPVEAGPIAAAAAETVRPAADARSIRLAVRCLASGAVAKADPDRLQQLVWNLLANSVKYTPEGGRVDLSVTRSGSQVVIQVTDTGQGIAAEFLPHVFERFRQGEATITRTHRGLGLGLALVRHLTEMHGGTARVESAGEGLGSTFTICLPAAAGPPGPPPGGLIKVPRPALAFEPMQTLQGLSVMVVDDETDTRQVLAAVLERCGARVTALASVAEAMSCLDRELPDVLVADIIMPGEDGYILIRKVRSLPGGRGRDLPAVALTACAKPEDRTRVLAEGYHIYVPKPVEPAELAAVVETLAKRARPSPAPPPGGGADQGAML